ncbi:MAG: SIMPL domain-containing protein [Chlorobiaceae bacterium]|nr:SIMPL domain-containing protein [Chlorobiaceae bacterium]NTW10413.1 SIMPL domain-containing protein [Chlorobiaceae bacterium]
MKKKSLTKRSRILFGALLLALTTGFSLRAYAEEPQLVVSSTGTVSVRPDMAEFGVVVKSEAKTAEKASAETAAKYRSVQDALRSAGIPLDDAPSSSYTVSPRWEWDQSAGRSVLAGYTARHVIMVKVRRLDGIGKAIDAAVQSGADEVQSVTFSSSRYEMLREQALAAAMENARKDAGIMAKSAGGRLGQLLEAGESQPPPRERPQMEFMAMKAAPAPASTEIAPSDQDISVSVTTRWRFIGTPVK